MECVTTLNIFIVNGYYKLNDQVSADEDHFAFLQYGDSFLAAPFIKKTGIYKLIEKTGFPDVAGLQEIYGSHDKTF